jgi:hypothetical protein
MSCSYEKRLQLTEHLLICRECGSNTSVAFGPYGFMSACRACGQCEHLDMMEPVWFAPVIVFPVLYVKPGATLARVSEKVAV